MMPIRHQSRVTDLSPRVGKLRQIAFKFGLYGCRYQLLGSCSQLFSQGVRNPGSTAKINNVSRFTWWDISLSCVSVSQQQINQIRRRPSCGATGKFLQYLCTKTSLHRCEPSGKAALRASTLIQVRAGLRTGDYCMRSVNSARCIAHLELRLPRKHPLE